MIPLRTAMRKLSVKNQTTSEAHPLDSALIYNIRANKINEPTALVVGTGFRRLKSLSYNS